MLKKNIANFITSLRIILGFMLLKYSYDQHEFIIIFTIAGLTDAIDGIVARGLKIQSKLGSVLDSIADFTFYIIMFVKIWPYLLKNLNTVYWLVIAIILMIRLFCYVSYAIKYKRFMSNHTILNKMTGLLLFLLPYAIFAGIFQSYSVITILVAIAAAIYELNFISLKKDIIE